MKEKRINFNVFYRSLVSSRGLWFLQEENEESFDLIDIKDFDEEEEEQTTPYSNELPNEIFVEYENSLSNFFMKEVGITEKSWINSKLSTAKEIETLDAFKNDVNNMIVRGRVFSLQYHADFNFYAYDKLNNILYLESFKDTLLIKDIVRAYYAYNIMNIYFRERNLPFEVKDIKYVCRKSVKDPKIKTFYFKITDVALFAKSKPTGKIKELLPKWDVDNMEYLNLFHEAKLINMILHNQFFSITINSKKAESQSASNILADRSYFNIKPKDEKDSNGIYVLPNFINQLRKINNDRDYKFDITSYKGKEVRFFEENNTVWGSNPDLLSLYEQLLGEEFAHLQGTKFPKIKTCKAFENGGEDFLRLTYFAKKAPENNEIKIHQEIVSKMIDDLNYKKIVWYDYESINLPYAVLEYTKPYQQIVSQVSVFRSFENKIIKEDDIVYDPQKISLLDFVDIFYHLYWEEADYYIVYNKNFENTRNEEMYKAIENKWFNDSSFKDIVKEKYNLNLEKIANIKNQIKEKTFDLMEFFAARKIYNVTVSSYNKDIIIPLVYLPTLLFKYSIKKIENYVTSNNLKLDHLIVPYKELDIKNGMYAQIEAIKRYLNQTKNESWPKVVDSLKKYCHNDVLAMIMVFDLVKYLLKQRYKNE
ncbi:UU173 family protein [Mycoplasma phocimorsus]|uniref:UU173 family protein n=1 Tax=Mycoplasma phocimorsus TaxID=3045839 RepID=UPI0024C04C6A|nr:DUF2779 domain-containing protein [Mycoplasma phocimorsus]MDJ1648527.1 DUF2779 domain-containing protein [Mycoplasma phocimorsus]